MNIVILHAYSAENAGDGLLVTETVRLLEEALGPDLRIVLAAAHPDGFAGLGVTVLDTGVSHRGYGAGYRRALRLAATADLVVGVGGGYLRAGHPVEAAKALLVHGPQLRAAARRRGPTVYLPQSIGPARLGTRTVLRRLLSRVDVVCVRDDRSAAEFAGPRTRRVPDLALLRGDAVDRDGEAPSTVPVLSIRTVGGGVPGPVFDLAGRLGVFDTYVQSTISGNDDRPCTALLDARKVLDRDDLLNPRQGERRVVVAVRLHAALMALHAGHVVVHLAYERKGFGAFADLGLEEFVHNVRSFDPDRVAAQVERLATDEPARRAYEQVVRGSAGRMARERAALVATLRGTVARR